MRKFVAILCTAALTLGIANTALAAPSIGQLIPEAPALVSSDVEIPDGLKVDVVDAKPEKYESTTVADVVTRFNDDDDETIMAVMDVLEALKDASDKALDPQGEIKTYHEELVINPEDYEPLMPIVDLVLTDDADVYYDLNGEVLKVKVTFKAEVVKDLDIDLEEYDKEDLLIMQVDPKTGEVYFIEIEEYDPETGEITAEFPCLGPFTILVKGTLLEEAVTE